MKPRSFDGRSGELLEQTGFRDVRIDLFDFLHPKTPIALIDGLNPFGRFLEKVPVIAEFAGSLYIRAREMSSTITVQSDTG